MRADSAWQWFQEWLRDDLLQRGDLLHLASPLVICIYMKRMPLAHFALRSSMIIGDRSRGWGGVGGVGGVKVRKGAAEGVRSQVSVRRIGVEPGRVWARAWWVMFVFALTW